MWDFNDFYDFIHPIDSIEFFLFYRFLFSSIDKLSLLTKSSIISLKSFDIFWRLLCKRNLNYNLLFFPLWFFVSADGAGFVQSFNGAVNQGRGRARNANEWSTVSVQKCIYIYMGQATFATKKIVCKPWGTHNLDWLFSFISFRRLFSHAIPFSDVHIDQWWIFINKCLAINSKRWRANKWHRLQNSINIIRNLQKRSTSWN